MKANYGQGAWALKVATDGTLWAGGAMTSAVRENGANQWVGGFVRFAVRPHTAPATPTNLTRRRVDGANAVDWSASATSGVKYEVLRNDRVVATVTGTTATIPGVSVRRPVLRARSRQLGQPVGLDARATSLDRCQPDDCCPMPRPGPTTSTTPHRRIRLEPAAFDASSWKTGAAPLGWGTGPITTNIDVPAGETRAADVVLPRSRSRSLARAFTTYTLTTRADDGIVVYVNGIEVGRSNMPAGARDGRHVRTVGAQHGDGDCLAGGVRRSRSRCCVPAPTSIAVEVHSNYRTTPSTSMDLSIVATVMTEGADHAAGDARAHTRSWRDAQKSGAGVPWYMRVVNRRLGRLIASLAAQGPVHAEPHDGRELRVIPRRSRAAGGRRAGCRHGDHRRSCCSSWASPSTPPMVSSRGCAAGAHRRGSGSTTSSTRPVTCCSTSRCWSASTDSPTSSTLVLLVPLAFGWSSTVRFFAQILAEQLARRDPVAGPGCRAAVRRLDPGAGRHRRPQPRRAPVAVDDGVPLGYAVLGALNALLLAATLVRRHRELVGAGAEPHERRGRHHDCRVVRSTTSQEPAGLARPDAALGLPGVLGARRHRHLVGVLMTVVMLSYPRAQPRRPVRPRRLRLHGASWSG